MTPKLQDLSGAKDRVPNEHECDGRSGDTGTHHRRLTGNDEDQENENGR